MTYGLINTISPAPRQYEMQIESRQSWDYYYSRPYGGGSAVWAFGPQQWPAWKGPAPTPLPYARILVEEGAKFLFRNGSPQFSVADDPNADAFLQTILRQNNLSAKWVSLAINAANQGAIAAKFSVDMDNPNCPVRISFLAVPTECRVWADPHDASAILLARIQYPIRNLEDGHFYWFREEWTPEHYVRYKDKYAGDRSTPGAHYLAGYWDTMGDDGEWQIETIEANPFGLIPITIIRNRAVHGDPLGTGDCWGGPFRIMDRLALALHGEDRNSQLNSEPSLVFLNAKPANEGPLTPGEPIVLVNENKDGPPADVRLLESQGGARQYTHEAVEKWEQLLYDTVGISRINPENVGNRGNMTRAVFEQLYARTIATSDAKRELWGESGMVPFLKNVLLALSRIGGIKDVMKVDEETAVACEWPQYFQATADDLGIITDRTIKQIREAGLPIDMGAERIARAEKMPQAQIDEMLDHLKAQRQAAAKQNAMAVNADPSEAADIDEASGVNNFTG